MHKEKGQCHNWPFFMGGIRFLRRGIPLLTCHHLRGNAVILVVIHHCAHSGWDLAAGDTQIAQCAVIQRLKGIASSGIGDPVGQLGKDTSVVVICGFEELCHVGLLFGIGCGGFLREGGPPLSHIYACSDVL